MCNNFLRWEGDPSIPPQASCAAILQRFSRTSHLASNAIQFNSAPFKPISLSLLSPSASKPHHISICFLQSRKFTGVLLLKNLIIIDPSACVTVREILDVYPVPLHTLYAAQYNI